ncbi:MAG: class I SAM-dependent methyltransferase [Sterolibacterium sp.]|jgi:SAM-dependent methyltransferase|nr:class I SAM-dependent methyltransferase [Sterolibacterium sp.]
MPVQGFDDWLATPQGQYILHWEQTRYDRLVADIFGYNALQIGLPQHDFLRANRMPFHLRCDDQEGVITRPVDLLASPHDLPFESASMDLVVLPHLLEFHAAPHAILREIERILVPEGSLIITGFNPFSLWGLRHRFTRSALAHPPWRGQYLSVLRLKDWFALLGLEPQSGGFGCYAPPFSQENRLQRWRFMELAGDRWWPYGGGVYIIQAIKRVRGMRLVGPGWRERMMRAKALALAQGGKIQPQPSPRISIHRQTHLADLSKPES